MSFVAPALDGGFPEHPVHGARAQLAELEQVVALCARRRVAIDVGAHIGTWTQPLSERFESVFAFEPEPENYTCLLRNTKGVLCYPVALGAEATLGGLTQHADNSGCFRVAPAQGTSVQVAALDDFKLRAVDLLKIDVEGYEGQVLLGATETLRHSSPVIVFEDNGLGPQFYGEEWVDPKPILRAIGYQPTRRIFKDEVWTRPGEPV